jgi:hypothetical protein
MPLWRELFLLLLCSGFIILVKVSGESRYGVVRLLLGGVNCYAYGLGLTSEGQRGTLIEEESDRGRLDLRAEPCLAQIDSDVFLGKEDEEGWVLILESNK